MVRQLIGSQVDNFELLSQLAYLPSAPFPLASSCPFRHACLGVRKGAGAIRCDGVAHLNEVPVFELGDKRLQLRRRGDVHETNLGEGNEERLGASQDGEILGLAVC